MSTGEAETDRDEKGGVRTALAGLTTRGRSFLAAGIAAAVCAYVLGQSDLRARGLKAQRRGGSRRRHNRRNAQCRAAARAERDSQTEAKGGNHGAGMILRSLPRRHNTPQRA